MSDFFSRAAQRAVGLGPRVEPVLAPRFAAPAGDPTSPDAAPFADHPADAAAPNPIGRPDPSHPSPAIDPAPLHAPAVSRSESRAAPSHPAPSHPAPRDASSVRIDEVRAEPVRPSTPPESASPAPRRGRNAVPPIAPPSPEAIVEAVESAPMRIDMRRASPARPAAASRRDPSPAPRSAGIEARADAHQLVEAQTARGEPNGVAAGIARPAAADGAIVPRTAVSRESAEPVSARGIGGRGENRGEARRAGALRPAAKAEPWAAESVARAASVAEAPAPEPVVKVSIGRVEVRAVFPAPQPAPATRAARSAPAPSPLQEYLRERNREARP